ncbi:rRNA-processing protein UTP23 homolog [Ruditapes philippinarum]|uniref:rRNA-processing protein UTP23 homolog n=1 Tax=Ruditapes philippinarum TaxID=129788 RepID=UPI00295B7BDF|nr:rRNA-processing protein UTP23 homolog [Ruditapes philippinarum]XP_060559048.1 rRNA-processing protein UTP23 homolog [Ruditapes philippinarum]
MKGKRQKNRKKCLLFYKNFFKFEPPYSILIDGTFCKGALQNKINIMDQMPKYLDAECKYFTTKCVLAECEALGTLLYGPLKVLRQFHVQPCRHDSPKPAPHCIRSVMKRNKHKFFVATQDPEFTELLRSLSGVPLIFIAFNTIILQSPADMSKNVANEKLERKLAPTDFAMNQIKELKRETFGEEPEKKKKKKHKMKGKNPLSCKKKKKRTVEEVNLIKQKKKRKKAKKQKMTLETLAAMEDKS